VQLLAAQHVLGHLGGERGRPGHQAAVLGGGQPVAPPQTLPVDGQGQAVRLVTVAPQLAQRVEHQRAEEAVQAVQQVLVQPLVGEGCLAAQTLQAPGGAPHLGGSGNIRMGLAFYMSEAHGGSLTSQWRQDYKIEI